MDSKSKRITAGRREGDSSVRRDGIPSEWEEGDGTALSAIEEAHGSGKRRSGRSLLVGTVVVSCFAALLAAVVLNRHDSASSLSADVDRRPLDEQQGVVRLDTDRTWG